MDDLIIVRKTKYQDDGLAFSDGNFTNLIMQQPGLEIVFDFMPKGSSGFFYVVESDKTTEFNFIMEGKLLVRDNNKSYILNAGDFLCQKGIDHFVSFEILEDTKLFYLNNRPYFDTYEKQVSGLLKVNNQTQLKHLFIMKTIIEMTTDCLTKQLTDKFYCQLAVFLCIGANAQSISLPLVCLNTHFSGSVMDRRSLFIYP